MPQSQSYYMSLGQTFVNFASCELEGAWNRVGKESTNDREVFEAQEDNAQINVRIFDYNKRKYYLKKGSKIVISGHVLKFNRQDFAKQS